MEEVEIKRSKELENVIKAIEVYIDKWKGLVSINIDVMAFEGKECEVVDDFMFSYGDKESLTIAAEEHLKMLKEDKDEFINW